VGYRQWQFGLALQFADVADATLHDAVVGLPMALIWELERA
jgi:hypothetical protein